MTTIKYTAFRKSEKPGSKPQFVDIMR